LGGASPSPITVGRAGPERAGSFVAAGRVAVTGGFGGAAASASGRSSGSGASTAGGGSTFAAGALSAVVAGALPGGTAGIPITVPVDERALRMTRPLDHSKSA
jgi:hypothetical protein